MNALELASVLVAPGTLHDQPELCLPLGLSAGDVERVAQLVSTRHRIREGDALYRAGDPFVSLYAVRSGTLKSAVMSNDGRDHVTGFHMAGDMVGFDAITTNRHGCDTSALEDSEVFVIPYHNLEAVARTVPALRRRLDRLTSREIVRSGAVMMLLGTMSAEQRVAAFLLDISQRHYLNGYSKAQFVLRMTRRDIGSYLGLTLETVSRMLSRFASQDLIEIDHKNVRLVDFDALRRLVSPISVQPTRRCGSAPTRQHAGKRAMF